MMRSFSVALLVTSLFSSPSQAWNKPGHMVTAAIAYMELKDKNPAVLAKVIKLLKEHPHHDDWQPTIAFIPAEDRDLYLFMKAARWPDDVRNDPQFHGEERDPWHFINFPFKPAGQPESVKTKPPATVNIIGTFGENLKELADTCLSEDERAVALCWIFHQVGDIHQPLHSSTLFTTDFPNGDRGGTRFYIRATTNTKSTKHLHSYWDGLIITSDKFSTVKSRAEKLRTDSPSGMLTTELAETAFDKWAGESFELAKKVAYKDGTLVGSRDEDNGEPLPSGYAKEAHSVARDRIVLAGYRLAKLLEDQFK